MGAVFVGFVMRNAIGLRRRATMSRYGTLRVELSLSTMLDMTVSPLVTSAWLPSMSKRGGSSTVQ